MPESPTPKKPSRKRMAQNALAVLDEAVIAAHDNPIELTPAIRLALGWLLLDEIAEYWQAERFSEAMTRASEVYIDDMASYVRRRDMAIYLDRWRADVAKWR